MAKTTKAKRTFGRGVEGTRNAMDFTEAVRGRPRKGAQAGGSRARSLRLPDKAWDELEARAHELEVPLHKLLRIIVAEWLYTSDRTESRAEHQARLNAQPRGKARAS